MAKTIRPAVNGVEVIPAHTGNLQALTLAKDIEARDAAKEADLQAEIQRLKAENEGLRNRPVSRLTLKISEKGALSVYGMGRFPVTLYREQWDKLLGMGEEIKAFIQANGHRLKLKGE